MKMGPATYGQGMTSSAELSPSRYSVPDLGLDLDTKMGSLRLSSPAPAWPAFASPGFVDCLQVHQITLCSSYARHQCMLPGYPIACVVEQQMAMCARSCSPCAQQA